MATDTIIHVIDDDAAVRDSIAFLLETADLDRADL
ncbi:FixJ family two-component response regulator [Brevundimonas alba]|uniref:FixJ family two-component response regulator n=1 Tax=Brevundimonas alba TaxID=74314 RepID=A0A7X5YJ23_9CAUL|nr:FixJ family two-component response regulator [Brevundimonas alba]